MPTAPHRHMTKAEEKAVRTEAFVEGLRAGLQLADEVLQEMLAGTYDAGDI